MMLEAFKIKEQDEFEKIANQLATLLKNFGVADGRSDMARQYVSELTGVPVANWITHTRETYGESVVAKAWPILFKLATILGKADELEQPSEESDA